MWLWQTVLDRRLNFEGYWCDDLPISIGVYKTADGKIYEILWLRTKIPSNLSLGKVTRLILKKWSGNVF
jgi:hypothetical protein